VNFGLFSLKVTETTTTVTKLLLLTWIGENVKPLTKARSAAHRKELANYVIVRHRERECESMYAYMVVLTIVARGFICTGLGAIPLALPSGSARRAHRAERALQASLVTSY